MLLQMLLKILPIENMANLLDELDKEEFKEVIRIAENEVLGT